jgi:16S rRNA processing protein RimM
MRCIPIGRILSPHGLKGEVKFTYYNEVKEDFSSYTSLFVQQDDQFRELRLSGSRIHKVSFLLTLEGIDSPEKARSLSNREVFVDEKGLPALEDGTYYDYQLVGLPVLNHLDEEIGRVVEVVHAHGTDFVVIGGREATFLPLIDDRIEEVNISEGYIKTRVGAGSP